MSRVLTLLSMLVLALLLQVSALQAQPLLSPQLLIGPPTDQQLADLLNNPDLWRQVHTWVGSIIYADHNFTKLPDETLREWFAAMGRQGLRLELEVGAVKEWSHEGAKTFEIERPIWERVNRMGGKIMSVAMDEPLIATRNMLHQSDDYAVEQTARFVAKVRQYFPTIEIGDIEPYPAISVQDQVIWIARLNGRLHELGMRGLDFYRIDPNWGAFPQYGSWAGVKSIVEACRTMRLRSSLIYWASGFAREKIRPPSLWTSQVVAEASAVQDVGGNADQVVVESWIGLPEIAVPETNPDSFTGSVKALMKILRTRHSK